MKLSKKIISVLLSTSYMFTSIVFADGTKKLEPVYLANVAQYMPMAKKIKLEQVSKNCDKALTKGYADDFLYVYILLNASVDESGHRKLVSSSDFEIAAKAFKNSIQYYCFKETAEVSTIPDEFRSLYRINKHNSSNVDKPHDIIFPRAYNLTFDGITRIVKKYGALEEKNNTEKAIKEFIKTKIFGNDEFTTSDADIKKLKKNLEDGLLSRLKKLEIDLNDKLDGAPLGQYHNCLHLYFTPDIKAIIDSAPCSSDITPSMLPIYACDLVDYFLANPPNLDSDIEEALRVVGKLPFTLKLQMKRLHILAQLAWMQENYTSPKVDKELVKTEYDNLQNLYSQFENAFNNQNYEFIKDIKNQYIEKINAKPLTAQIFAGSNKTEQEVFNGYLTKKTNGLKPETRQFLYKFFCTLKNSKACRLYEVRSIIDELVNTNEIQPLDFAAEDIHRTPLRVAICNDYIKTYVLPNFKNPYEAKYGIRWISKMFNITGSTMDLDALQTVVYIMYKLGCEPTIIQNMQNALLATYVPNNSKDINKIKRIFKTAGRGKPKHLDKDLGTIEYTLNDTEETIHPPIGNISRNHTEKSRSPKNSNFGTALVGVTGLSALGALVYNGINKYKNKPSNISKSKNNKNINKKIAKNIS